jgi:radical SAM protein with 4Fe4S-binding SPASM domain
MLALSGALHLVLAILALFLPRLSGAPLRLEPVAVVDLIGGGEFRGDAGKPPGPPPREARAKTPPAGKIPLREKHPPRGKTAGAAREEKPSRDAFPSSKRRADDAAALRERLRRMRETREGAESVREAVEQRRREAALRRLPDGRAGFWTGCTAGIRTVGICSDGEVKGCPSHPRAFSAGNVRREPFRAIWEDRSRFAYNTEWREEQLVGGCVACALRRICRGGCRTMAWSVTGTIFDNPFCLQRVPGSR